MALVTLAGQPCMGDRLNRWALTTGTQPYVGSFSVPARFAANVEAATRGLKPTVLKIQDTTIRNVFVTNRLPSGDPRIVTFQVADFRILWNYVWVGPRDYNITRQTGDKRYFGSTDSIGQRDQTSLATDIDYLPHSTFDKTGAQPWQAPQMVNDVLRAIFDKLRYFFSWQINTTAVNASSRTVPVRNLTIDDLAPAAMRRALSFVPGTSVFVELDGSLSLIDKLDGKEVDVIESGSAMPYASPPPQLVSRADVRPQAMDLLFTRRVDLRFKWNDGTSPTVIAPGAVTRQLENVMRVMLPSLTINGVEKYFGTWDTFDNILGGLTGQEPAFAGGPLTTAIIRQGLPAGVLMMEYASGNGVLAPDPDWVRIIREITRCYRLCFRIPREWTSRFQAWYTTLGAVLDEESASLGKSPVFAEYAIRWPQDRYTRYGGMEVHRQIAGYADLVTDSKDSGADLQILSQPLGIFKVNYTVDNWGKIAQVYPSLLATTVNGKMHRLDYRTDPIIEAGLQLAENHNMSTIISAVPNGSGTLYRVRVTPDQAKAKLGNTVRIGISRGPVKELRVTSDIMQARFGWLDEGTVPELLENMFGVRPNVANVGEPDTLLNEEELKDVAQSIAAAEYSRFADTVMGQASHVGISGKPAGTISESRIEVATTGEVTTTHIMPAEPPRVDWRTLINEGTRRFLRMELGPDQ